MALKIRLRRMGRKNAPTYRIVVAESSMPRDGRIIESIGHYNPRTEPLTLSVDRAKALGWMERGAQPTDTAMALLKRAGVFRPEEEGVVATVAAAAARGAKQAVEVARDAAEKVVDVAEDVVEKVAEVADRVRSDDAADSEAGNEAEPSVAEADSAKSDSESASESAEVEAQKS
jgi:small subunit ribosomal protein S16